MYIAPRPGKDSSAKMYRYFAFLSFRWQAGSDVARWIQAEFLAQGMHTYLDVQHVRRAEFDEAVLVELELARNFIVVLSPGALDPCSSPTDWMRREIAHAIRTERNIVPVLKEGFRFPSSQALPPDIADLPRYNCVEYSPTYLNAALDKVVSFCSIPQAPRPRPGY